MNLSLNLMSLHCLLEHASILSSYHCGKKVQIPVPVQKCFAVGNYEETKCHERDAKKNRQKKMKKEKH